METTFSDDFVCVIQDVYKSIDDVQILKDLDLKIRKGRVTALLGPNGAGKTSTIRVILGLLKPQLGSVTVLGVDVKKNPEAIRQKVGLLPQSDAGYKTLSTRENLEFLLKLSGRDMDKIQENLQNLLVKLDLEDVMDQEFGTLSGGERRAIGFIRAILTGSEFLILDEPTTGLDLARAAAMRRIIQEQVREGKTILMSSHVITDLEELAEDIIIMKDGMVEISGTREEIQNYYAPGGRLEDAIVTAFTREKNHREEYDPSEIYMEGY